jgi:thiosulfate dehydrogenase [quinone] large subunit
MLTASRRFALPLAAVAAALLVWMVNPWVEVPEGIVSQVVTVAFWVLFLVVLVLLFGYRNAPDADVVEVEGPGVTRFLFSNSQAGLFWLPVRLFLGFSWLEAGLHKLTDPAWTSGGEALRGYWERAAAIPEQGRPLITFEWYRSFIQLMLDNGAEAWFSYVIMFGEIAVGVGLVLGLLTGVAAFFGAFMNMSFLLAGSASTNPVLFTFAIGLMLAWRVAGYYGIDRWVLPMLGTPWRARVGIRPQASST